MDGSAAMKAKLKRYGDLDEPFLRWAVQSALGVCCKHFCGSEPLSQ